MACHWLKLTDGSVVHVNMGRPRRSRCGFCNVGWVSRLCDYAIGNGSTCDAGMCARCATRVGEDKDYCPNHKSQDLLYPEVGDAHATR